MITTLTVIHITVCVFLVAVVLLQHGKGADVGATFGGAGNTIFGPRGAATLLTKMTRYAAIIFMGTSLSLAYLSAHESTQSVFREKDATPVASPAAKASVPDASPAAPTAAPKVSPKK
ncbi:MAG: preprotein translocase subunit SecG [Pseudomonadota bacterium]